MSTVIAADIQEEDDFKFVPCYQTSDIGMLNIIKHFLKNNDIPNVVFGEELLFLTGAAIPFEDGLATIHLMKKDIPKLMDFIENP